VYIEAEAARPDAIAASSKGLRRKPFGTGDPALDRLLQEAARLRVDGRAKSDRNALMQALGGDHRLESLKKRWMPMKASLPRGAERTREIETQLIQENRAGLKTHLSATRAGKVGACSA